jgi:hypothetical protein
MRISRILRRDHLLLCRQWQVVVPFYNEKNIEQAAARIAKHRIGDDVI